MTDLAKRIAVLLANYEMDEPSVRDPYRALTIWAGHIDNWVKREHDGDCVKQPQQCLHCMADEWILKGKWIADRLEEGK